MVWRSMEGGKRILKSTRAHPRQNSSKPFEQILLCATISSFNSTKKQGDSWNRRKQVEILQSTHGTLLANLTGKKLCLPPANRALASRQQHRFNQQYRDRQRLLGRLRGHNICFLPSPLLVAGRSAEVIF
mmetsp:Transcript_2683/g.6416  ORF Transcript_2683/g.6416 Transcript_2683/m.6416 type:complete len:130 (+) Transcript_2683:290-679(+)